MILKTRKKDKNKEENRVQRVAKELHKLYTLDSPNQRGMRYMSGTNKNVRKSRIAFHVTDEEKKAIEKMADEKGLSVSAYVRLILSDLAKKA